MSEKKTGRPRIGTPVSITLTAAQRAWLDAQVTDRGSFTAAVRAILQILVDEKIKDIYDLKNRLKLN